MLGHASAGQILGVLKRMRSAWERGVGVQEGYVTAVKEEAAQRKVTEQSVRDKTARGLGLSKHRFAELADLAFSGKGVELIKIIEKHTQEQLKDEVLDALGSLCGRNAEIEEEDNASISSIRVNLSAFDQLLLQAFAMRGGKKLADLAGEIISEWLKQNFELLDPSQTAPFNALKRLKEIGEQKRAGDESADKAPTA